MTDAERAHCSSCWALDEVPYFVYPERVHPAVYDVPQIAAGVQDHVDLEWGWLR